MWDPPGPEIKAKSPALAGGFFTTEPSGKPWYKFLESRNISSKVRLTEAYCLRCAAGVSGTALKALCTLSPWILATLLVTSSLHSWGNWKPHRLGSCPGPLTDEWWGGIWVQGSRSRAWALSPDLAPLVFEGHLSSEHNRSTDLRILVVQSSSLFCSFAYYDFS